MRTKVTISAFLVWMFVYVPSSVVDAVVTVYPIVFRYRTLRRSDHYGWPEKKELHFDIMCKKPRSPLRLPENVKLIEIVIYDCQIPDKPLAELLRENNNDYTELTTLQYINNFMLPSYTNNITAGLPIQALGMTNLTNFREPPNFFTSPTNLTELIFESMKVPPLPPPESLRLTSLTVKYSSVKTWDNCKLLHKLLIVGLIKEEIPEWPENCTQLTELRLQLMPIEAALHVTETINENSSANLEHLEMVNCSLVQLPLSIMHSKKLISVDLSHNKLTEEAVLQFPALINLKALNLSYNKELTTTSLLIALSRLPELRELILNNVGYGYWDLIDLGEALAKLKSLEVLHLDTQMDQKEVYMHYHFPNLKHLSMRNEKRIKFPKVITVLRLHGFPSTDAKHLVVDLRGNLAKYVSIGPGHEDFDEYIERSRSWLINKGYKLTVHLDAVDCNCANEVLAHILRYYPHFLDMPDLKCWQGGLFKDQSIDNLSCRKATVNGCKRKMSKDLNLNYTTEVDCSNNKEKFRWPQPQGFRGFNASGNQIASLDKAYLPDTLEWLDLRYNNISRLNSEQSARLFGNKGRRVWLSGNQIVCDCENQPLLDALHVNQSLVHDYDILMCAENDKPLRLVSVDELCRPKLLMVSLTTSLLVVLALIVALIVRHFWTTIRMILFAHGCCVSCLREEDLDDDRPFDAFLSFAHGDNQYVMDQLLPKLEGDPNFYRICVHYRDWLVGEWIPAQIMQSVRLSKRTIIVLSKNFVKSSWGILEFRHANSGATADGRRRLLVLVLDDVLSENLSPELQGYLDLNTYLNCHDPWFWEKLQYAMPHKDGEQRRTNRDRMNFDPQVCALAQHPYYSEEVLSMQVIEPTDDSEEVPSRSVNVVITTE